MNLPWNLKYPYQNDEILNLDWVINQINDFRNKLEEWSKIAEELAEALTDIAGMKSDIKTLQDQVAALQVLKSELDSLAIIVNHNSEDIEYLKTIFFNYENELEAIRQLVLSEAALLNQKINSLEWSLKNDYNVKFAKVLRLINELAERVANIDTTVINPWHQELNKVSPDKNNKLVYNDLAGECPTAEEYLKLGLTADEYKDYGLRAINYAKFGKIKLRYYWVYMPVEGVKQEISNVLTSIADHVFDTYSAFDYAALDLSADDYAALNYSATDYLKANYSGGGGGGDTRNFIKFDIANSGLTVNQYDHLGVSPT